LSDSRRFRLPVTHTAAAAAASAMGNKLRTPARQTDRRTESKNIDFFFFFVFFFFFILALFYLATLSH
jgi:hypothetical protein